MYLESRRKIIADGILWGFNLIAPVALLIALFVLTSLSVGNALAALFLAGMFCLAVRGTRHWYLEKYLPYCDTKTYRRLQASIVSRAKHLIRQNGGFDLRDRDHSHELGGIQRSPRAKERRYYKDHEDLYELWLWSTELTEDHREVSTTIHLLFDAKARRTVLKRYSAHCNDHKTGAGQVIGSMFPYNEYDDTVPEDVPDDFKYATMDELEEVEHAIRHWKPVRGYTE